MGFYRCIIKLIVLFVYKQKVQLLKICRHMILLKKLKKTLFLSNT